MTSHDLFVAIYPSLRRFAAVVAPPGVHPDDLVQDALARRLAIGPVDDLDDPVAYLRAAIVNLAHNSRRSARRAVRAAARLAATDTEDVAYPSDLADLARLQPRERAALYLHHVEGYAFADIAHQLGCSEAAARQAASRGRRRLATSLEEDER